MSKKNTEENFVVTEDVVTDNFTEFDTPNVEVVEVVEKSTPKTKWDTTSCKVVSKVGKDKVIVDFNGFGLIVSTDKLNKKDVESVDIKYCGTIGESDFVYEVK